MVSRLGGKAVPGGGLGVGTTNVARCSGTPRGTLRRTSMSTRQMLRIGPAHLSPLPRCHVAKRCYAWSHGATWCTSSAAMWCPSTTTPRQTSVEGCDSSSGIVLRTCTHGAPSSPTGNRSTCFACRRLLARTQLRRERGLWHPAEIAAHRRPFGSRRCLRGRAAASEVGRRPHAGRPVGPGAEPPGTAPAKVPQPHRTAKVAR